MKIYLRLLRLGWGCEKISTATGSNGKGRLAGVGKSRLGYRSRELLKVFSVAIRSMLLRALRNLNCITAVSRLD
jgi:hypothetical protein